MPGEADRRRRVGGGLVGQRQRVLVDADHRRDVEVAGKAVDARGRMVPELHVGVLAAARTQHFPHVFAEADVAAVQRVAAIVGGELVSFTVEVERGAGDAIAVTADELSEIGGVFEIGRQVRQRQHQRNTFASLLARGSVRLRSVPPSVRISACSPSGEPSVYTSTSWPSGSRPNDRCASPFTPSWACAPRKAAATGRRARAKLRRRSWSTMSSMSRQRR